jgi:Raf kinase inhibitor-like YbhB/YbcL family protein
MDRRPSFINRIDGAQGGIVWTRETCHEARMRTLALVAVSAGMTLCVACKSAGGEPSAPPGRAMETLAVTSRSFPSNGEIPVDSTCDGANRSPELTWSAPPEGTRSFAVIVEDPDAPSGTFTHWIVYGIGADARALPEGVDPSTIGGASGLNDFKRPGYGGPCPPSLEFHHYYFRVYALNAPINTGLEPNRDAIDAAMGGHVLAAGTLVGTFSH